MYRYFSNIDGQLLFFIIILGVCMISFRKANVCDIDEISVFVDEAKSVMEKQGIFQWDEIYPLKEDFAADETNGQLYVGEMDGKIALKNGNSSIKLDAFTQNPIALSMYEKLGYKVKGYADWRKGKFVLMEKVLKKL